MIGAMLAGAAGVIAVPAVGGLAYRAMRQRQVAKELAIDTPNGIVEERFIRIGGIDQWIQIRGEDRANPVLLVLHGGPGWPNAVFNLPLRSWEKDFTVVQWDHRGAGKTLGLYGKAGSGEMTFDRRVADAIEVCEYLRNHLHKDKVILLAESMGTLTGTPLVMRRPDLFHAYVGIGQVISTRENERLSFEYGLRTARERGNQQAIREMEAIAPYPGNTPITRERIIVARKWPQFYGGLTAYRETSDYFYRAARLSPEYDDRDRCAINAGSVFTLGKLLDEFLQVDFTGVREFPIPVVMFMGRHDYTTPSEPTAQWIDAVKAPYKRGVWFEHSAHMMPWEEPGKTLVSLLEHVRPLAVDDSRTSP